MPLTPEDKAKNRYRADLEKGVEPPPPRTEANKAYLEEVREEVAHAGQEAVRRQTRKGKDWHFGMKAHVGTDRRGIVHSLTTTDAAGADITQMPQLLHGEEREVFGDQAYWKEADRQAARERGAAAASARGVRAVR